MQAKATIKNGLVEKIEVQKPSEIIEERARDLEEETYYDRKDILRRRYTENEARWQSLMEYLNGEL